MSRLLPTTYAFEAMRTLLDGGAMPWGDLARAGFGGLALLVVSAIVPHPHAARRSASAATSRGTAQRPDEPCHELVAGDIDAQSTVAASV